MSPPFISLNEDDANYVLNYYHEHGSVLVDKSYHFVQQMLPEDELEVVFDQSRLCAVFLISLKLKGIPLNSVDWDTMISGRRLEGFRPILDIYDDWLEHQMGLHEE